MSENGVKKWLLTADSYSAGCHLGRGAGSLAWDTAGAGVIKGSLREEYSEPQKNGLVLLFLKG